MDTPPVLHHIRLFRSIALSALLFFSGSAFGAPATPPKLAAPPKDAVDAAIKAPLVKHNRAIKGGAHTNMSDLGEAPVILAAAALSGDTSADARLLEQMRYSLQGGNDLTCNGGYPAQHDRDITTMYAIAKLVPRIWTQLTPKEQHAIDLVMQAAFVASAFTSSDKNPFYVAKTQQYSLDSDSNLNRDWNPNFREGIVGGVLIGVIYFGGPEKAQAILDNYKHDAFVADLASSGLTNIHETFNWKAAHPESNAPTGEAITTTIKNYRYNNLALTDYMKIYQALTENTYGAPVSAGVNNGQGMKLPDGKIAGVVVSGADQLPNKGKMGMLKEFASMDAKGPRSAIYYSYDGFRCNLVNHYALLATGYWQDGESAKKCLDLMQVGITDLWFKYEHGYANYSKGHGGDVTDLKNAPGGIKFTRPLWEQIIKPYHHLQ